MKKIVLICLLSLFYISSKAQNTVDTSAYGLQRNIVNQLLQERTSQFGQYSESLNARSGIFGWQTKGDIQKSAEILLQIAQKDDEVFKQLKILLDYKDLEKKNLEQSSDENKNSLTQHMATINKLQSSNDALSKENQILQKKNDMVIIFTFVFAILSAILTFIVLKKKS